MSRSTIPDATTHTSSAGGPVFASEPDGPAADVVGPRGHRAGAVVADDVAGATVVLVVPELPLELVFAAAVVVVWWWWWCPNSG